MGGVAPNYANPKLISSAEREAVIIERRASSVPYRVIAAELGISVSNVHKIYRMACDRIPAEAIHTIRVESSELAARAIADLLTIAENPQVSPRTRAECWGHIRSWNESVRRLNGADAPTRREVTVISDDSINNAIAELTREMELAAMQAREAGIEIPA